jgi:hypothetical protein
MIGAVDLRHHALVAWLLAQGANVNPRASARSRHTAPAVCLHKNGPA